MTANDELIPQITQIVDNVNQIVMNIKNGDCPFRLHSAYMTIHDLADLTKANAVVVYTCYTDESTTPVFKLFESLFSDKFYGMSRRFTEQKRAGLKMKQAVQRVVDEAVCESSVLRPCDATRLKKLYTVWMKGVSWAKCEVSRCAQYLSNTFMSEE